MINDKVDLTDESEIEKINQDYNLSQQKKVLLENEDSTADIKLAITVKKLDNSIYDFLELTSKAEAIRKYRTRLYMSNKKDYYAEEVDHDAEIKASLEGGDKYLN